MESQSGLIAGPQIAADMAEQDLLLIAGSIGLDGLTARAGAGAAGRTDERARVTTRCGCG